MSTALRWLYRSLRTLIVTLLVILPVALAVIYVGSSLNVVQNQLRQRAQSELSALLGTDVTIGRVTITPFNQFTLTDIAVDTFLTVDRIGAGVLIGPLLRGRIVVSYAELIGADLKLNRPSPGEPLNVQAVLDRLKGNDSNEPTAFSLAVQTVVIRRTRLSYDVISEPVVQERFDPNHIALHDVKADISLPVISNEAIQADLRRLAFTERCGFAVNSLSFKLTSDSIAATIDNFTLSLPSSTRIAFEPLRVHYGPLDSIASTWPNIQFHIATASGNEILPADFAPFIPELANINTPISIEFEADGCPDDFTILQTELSSAPFSLRTSATVWGIASGNPMVDVSRLDIQADGPAIASMLSNSIPSLPDKATDLLATAGDIKLCLTRATLSSSEITATGSLTTDTGTIDLDSYYNIAHQSFDAEVAASNIDAAAFTPNIDIPPFGLQAKASGSIASASSLALQLDATVTDLSFQGYHYAPIAISGSLDGNIAQAAINLDDENGHINAEAEANISSAERSLTAKATIAKLRPDLIALTDKYPDYQLDTAINLDIQGSTVDNITGFLLVDSLTFVNGKNDLRLNRLLMTAQADTVGYRRIDIMSDAINATADGHFSINTIASTARSVLAKINPEVFAAPDSTISTDDVDITLNATLAQANPIGRFLKLPVDFLVPVNISAAMSGQHSTLSLQVNAPYLAQGNKIIEHTSLDLTADGLHRTSSLYANTSFPAKGGYIDLTVECDGINGRHDTHIDWMSESMLNFGSFRFSTAFANSPQGLLTDIAVNPGQIVFNDSIWTVSPAKITARKNYVKVKNFRVSHSDQLLHINGIASTDTIDKIDIRLRDIDLDYVFGTLNIPNVMFGGQATGLITASSLFSGQPRLSVPSLLVDDLSYNNCVMGDGVIHSDWQPETGAITIDAVINQDNGLKSFINGSITPAQELLDFHFDAHKANVGFLQPFMEAFCDGIRGQASGTAHLYGDFHDIDMTGDLFAHDIKLDIGFTGTTYATTDSVHISPGRIAFSDVVIRDESGNTALFSGVLKHRDFHDPVFDFTVTNARNFLFYDQKETIEHPWYGRIYGNGTAAIKGHPGIVSIEVNMSTAANTDFTFVLSDAEIAADYNFITFRDCTPDSLIIIDIHEEIPPLVSEMRERLSQHNNDDETVYAMTFNIDITPDARMNLVMDPQGGDKIKATGQGNVRMSYDSASEDLKMYGSYVLNQGSYNFTLQDIIIKDFTIEEGSSITFHGDPYRAVLDIKAYYSLNANLSDLDESFNQDTSLNRTNVPVHAVLLVTGDLQNSDIGFDLELPTVNDETYRKVRSIVSTEEMMSRQIIYLLALNRFYTPEYMSTTSGNELVSVASSTISSQLSTMLGALSDKVSIAPTFRSDRGDFSDVEVDVALSSQLLNNRLLLNGTFGYRDKSLNNNSFIGDFDIEYLLNRPGSVRLKAYNHYNDQNYYLKSALTTQGVGVVFKHDFNSFSDLFRRHAKSVTPTDSMP